VCIDSGYMTLNGVAPPGEYVDAAAAMTSRAAAVTSLPAKQQQPMSAQFSLQVRCFVAVDL